MSTYTQDNMTIHNGDCLEVMKGIPDGSVDAIITDPPYGTTACKWDNVIPFDLMWAQLNRVIKDRGAVLLFGSEPFSSSLRMSNISQYKYDWIWEKPNGTNFISVNYQPFRVYENICVFSSGAITYTKDKARSMPYNPQKTKGKPYTARTGESERASVHRAGSSMGGHKTINTGERHPRNVVRFNTEKGFHPTQKPVALMEYLIKTYTNEGETVLDFTMGSGTTGVACKNLNRSFIGIEMDDKYFEIAKERINKEPDQLELF